MAHKFGAKDYSGMRRFVANGMWLSILFSAVMTVVTAVFCREMLTAMKTPEDIFSYAYSYIFIIFLGIPATYLYNMLSGIIRAMGDSKTPLVFLPLRSSLVFLIKKFPLLHMEQGEWKVNIHYMGTLCGMGVPMGLQYSITAIGSVILQTAVNTLGASAVASVTAAGKVGMFFCCPYDALGSTMATYGGQNVGAKKPERLGQGIKASMVIAAVYSAAALLILYLYA